MKKISLTWLFFLFCFVTERECTHQKLGLLSRLLAGRQTGLPLFAVSSEPVRLEQRHHRYCIFIAAAQMTKRINHTAIKLRLINYPWINKSLQRETGAVNQLSLKDPLRSFFSLFPFSLSFPIQAPEIAEKYRAVKITALTAKRWGRQF